MAGYLTYKGISIRVFGFKTHAIFQVRNGANILSFDTSEQAHASSTKNIKTNPVHFNVYPDLAVDLHYM